MKKLSVLLLLLTVLYGASFAQGMGANFDMKTIAETPMKVSLSFRSFQSMPSSYSLEQYAPTPGDQGAYGTCAAWANGYSIPVILYSKTHNISQLQLRNKYGFSPTFIYEIIKNKGDNDCSGGSDPLKAILLTQKIGSVLLSKLPYSCGGMITDEMVNDAANYKTGDFNLLFAAKGMTQNDEYYKEPSVAVELVKKALSEGSAVSGGFAIPASFKRAKGAVWESSPNDDYNEAWQHGRHAMAIIGYDDNKFGGAFRIMNSWGTSWGDGGFVWMRYEDFKKSAIVAIQVFADPNTKQPEESAKPEPKPEPKPQPQPDPKPQPQPQPQPKPKPAPAEQTFVLSGDVEFKLNTGEDMPIKKTSTRNLTVEDDEPQAKEDLVAYTMAETYSSGTKFRFYLNVDKEAYVYAFATDLSGKVNLILPYADNISTHVGSNSVIAFPSDTKVIKMDENKGRDYLLILYSAGKLDAKGMAEKMNSMKGALSDKIKAVLGSKLIDRSKIEYYKDKVGFATKKMSTRNLTVEDDDSKPSPTGGSVVPLMVEIKHN